MFEFQKHPSVKIGGFWEDKQRLVREVTIPYQWNALNDRVPGADRSGAVRNFKIAAGKAKGSFEGFFFQDSDLAKWIEAAAYSLTFEANPKLERAVDRLIDTIAAVQDEDGYLNTYYTIAEKKDLRWTDLRDKHELYVSGHMLEAGIAYFEATGKRVLLDAMIENVDLIARLFGRGGGRRRGYPGHPEIELALMRLYDVTGDSRHLRLARYFIDERGATPKYFERETKRLGKKDFRSDAWYAFYNQSHVPIRDQKEIVGHAVRACYLFAAAADVARETDDRELFRAVKRLWRSATERRMYVTGGLGSTLLGEAFTFDYDLPNEWAYSETCAAIALVFWSRRMLRMEADSRYADVIERVLYNGYLSALSQDGTHCFYRNPLASVPDPKYPNRHIRRAWHECACCPPNFSRLMMSLGGYVYSRRDRDVFVHLFIDSETSMDIGGLPVRVSQKTDYPWDGRIELSFRMPAVAGFRLFLRIPAWTRAWTVRLNGELPAEPISVRRGYARIDRTWSDGDRVTLDLPMPAERIHAHPGVRQNVGCIALQRGPVLYCLEQADNGSNLHELVLPQRSILHVAEKHTALGDIPVITADARRRTIGDPRGPLYLADADLNERRAKITAIPYYLWANRGMGEMRVWIREIRD